MVVKAVQKSDETFDEISLLEIGKKNLIEYANAVILDRALPDYRDGLKPVHRRILYSMWAMNLKHNGGFVKSARVVGDVMGKYHPHGDLAIYGALVKMAHLSEKPIIPMGSFGSVTEKRFAAQRYTEVKLSAYGENQFFHKHLKALVPFVPNYDGKDTEPLYLPCLMPNLFLNGTSGIAVGITSNVPPVTMESLVPFLDKVISGKEIKAKDLAEKLVFNWEYGSHVVPGPSQGDENVVLNWIENGTGSLYFEPEYHLDSQTRTLVVTEAPPFFNWDKVVDNITKQDKKSGKAKYPFVSTIDDMCSKEGIRFEVKFKSTIDRAEFATYAKRIVREFTNSFSTATNVTFRKTSKNQFFKSNIIDLIERWCHYRVNLEIKIQKQNILLIDTELKRFDLLLKVIEGRDHIRNAWNQTDPHKYVETKLKITEEESKQVLSWNLLSPSNLNKDKILADKAVLVKRRKEHVVIQENPAPTVCSYLSTQTSTL